MSGSGNIYNFKPNLTGCIQALVFCMLTMVYVGAACPPPAPKPEKK